MLTSPRRGGVSRHRTLGIMEYWNNGILGIKSEGIIVFLVGGITVHFVVMLLDYFLMVKPLLLDPQANFADSIFSTAVPLKI